MSIGIDELGLKQTMGFRIRLARQKRNLTMEEVASQLGSSRGYIANVESGTTNLSLIRVIEFSKILEVDPAWLTGFRNSDEGLFIDELTDFITDDFVLKSTFLDKKGLKSDRILSVEVVGKSMEPTIKAGSFAIANMEATGIIERDLFVLKVEDKYCVRWVEPTVEGNYKIESNQNDPFFMPNCTVTPMELTQIEIIGRVELIVSSRD